MKAADLRQAALDVGITPARLCAALEVLSPVLERSYRHQPFWLQWGVNSMLDAFKQYRTEVCAQLGQPLNKVGK